MEPLKTYIDTKQLREDLQFTASNLSEAFARQAALFAHYAALAGQAEFQCSKTKQAMEIMEARADKQVRNQAVEDGEKLTEAMVSKRVLLTRQYQEARRRYNESKMIATLCRDACESFKQRRDMLVQAGADLRQEMAGELRMRYKELEMSDKQMAALSKIGS